jgi:4'-phosphopantetheinyl transferase EntD
MELMGLPGSAILVGKDRAPVWPTGIAGSISHTQGLAGAMVCSNSHYRSIGLDIERRSAVDRKLWDLLFDELEQQRIEAATSPDDEAALLFSLKEAYYKMQYPLSGMFLDFRDVRVEDGPNGVWINRLKPLSVAAPAHRAGYVFSGEYVVSWVLAGG